MGRRKRRHAPYTTPLPDDSRRRFLPPEAQSQPQPVTQAQSRIHPSVVFDEREAAQEREIETLVMENHRVAAAHVALKQDISAAQQELSHLSSTAATIKAKRDAEVREVYDKARKKESDVRIVDELSVEVARVKADIQNMIADRKELTAKLQVMEDDLVKVRSELQKFPVIKAEIEAMHKEVQRGRAAIDYEKKMHASNLEYSQAMEKHKITVTSEIEKLHAELANAEKRARAAAAAAAPSNLNHQFSGATPNFTYSANHGNPETGYGEHVYPSLYTVHQVQGSADASTQYVSGAMPYGSQPYVHH